MFASLAFSELTRGVLSPSTKMLLVSPRSGMARVDAFVEDGRHAWQMRMLDKPAWFSDGCSQTTTSIEDCSSLPALITRFWV